MTVAEELRREMDRVRDLVRPWLTEPRTCARQNAKRVLRDASEALARGDVREMLSAHEALRCYTS